MEASLLPSAEMQDLCQEVSITATRHRDELSEKLRQEFDIRCYNSWVVILDGKGETLDSFIGDEAGRECTEDAAKQFPAMFVQRIRVGLEKKHSLQELTRQWDTAPTMKSFGRLEKRLKETSSHGMLARICDGAAANSAFSEEMRITFRMEAFLARGHTWYSIENKAEMMAEGERLIVEYPSHTLASEILMTLFRVGLHNEFDVRTKTSACMDRLAKSASDLKHEVEIQPHLLTLKSLLSKRLDGLEKENMQIESYRHEVPDETYEYMKMSVAAHQGKAKEVMAYYSHSTSGLKTHPLLPVGSKRHKRSLPSRTAL